MTDGEVLDVLETTKEDQKCCNKECVLQTVRRRLPVVGWLPHMT